LCTSQKSTNLRHCKEAFACLPVGKELRHQRLEAGVVAWFQQMHQFVDNDVFERLGWPRCQGQRQPDAPGRWVASAPAGAHAFDAPKSCLDAHSGLPQGQQRTNGGFELGALPFLGSQVALRVNTAAAGWGSEEPAQQRRSRFAHGSMFHHCGFSVKIPL